jgi:hypothetical protein
MVLILLNESPVDCRKEYFSKTARNRIFFAEWFASDNFKSILCSFMQLHNKKIYFASDQHFGAPTPELSFPENKNSWHGSTKLKVMPSFFLLGDLFDFWFEYKTVVQKVSSVFWVN